MTGRWVTISAPLVLSTASGLLMVGATDVAPHGPAFVAAIFAVVAVLAAAISRAAASIAVVLTVLVIVLSHPSPVLAALSGLSATAYLVLRHAVGTRGVVTATAPTMIAAAGFSLGGLVAASFPLRLPWLPLLAPLAVLAIYVLATRPFASDRDG
jgi:hypothetical protein